MLENKKAASRAGLTFSEKKQLEEREKIKKEVRYLEEKAKGASRKPQNAGK